MAYQELIKEISAFFVKIIISLVIFIIGLILGKFIGNLIKKILSELEIRRILGKRFDIDSLIEEKIGNTIKYLVYITALFISLNQLGLFRTFIFVLAVIIVAIVTVFILNAAKDFIPNFISYFKIKNNKNFKSNSKIKLNNIQGYIVNVSWHETKIKSKNDVIYVPNYLLYKNLGHD